MPLSSSSIIHFTKKKRSLCGILEDNFHIHYCRETVWLGGENQTFSVPMVSFCDIPLSQIKDHIKKYGQYGIGLTKEWAKKKLLNPVLYVETDSHLSRSYKKAFDDFFLESDSLNASHFALVDILRYIKNYEGLLARSGKEISNYRFSDEREWRFVPSYDASCEFIVGDDDYNNESKRLAIEKSVASIRLYFEPNDIKYIIIKSEDEISEFIQILRNAKSQKYTSSDIDRLTTRILTTEQILSDI